MSATTTRPSNGSPGRQKVLSLSKIPGTIQPKRRNARREFYLFLESSLVDGASKTLQVLEIAPDHFVPNTSELSLEL